MRTKILANILIALALPLAPTGARADSQTGATTITIGSTPVSGTAGLLYSDGALVQSLAGTVTSGSNGTSTYTNMLFGNNVQFSFTTDGYLSSPYAALLSFNNTSTTGGWGAQNMLEIYSNLGGIHSLNTYINGIGIYSTRLNILVSGHVQAGTGTGGNYGPNYAILSPNNYLPNMYGCWSDVTGPCFMARNNGGTAGELSFSGQKADGTFTIGLDAENTRVIFGATTISGSGQIFTGDTFVGRAAAANIRFGGADAAAPVAQTLSFQSVLAGTSNTAGVNTTFKASAGTGTGAGGSFLFQTALAGSSGTTQNAFTTALTIDGSTGVTIGSPSNTGTNPQLTFAPASGNGVGISASAYGNNDLEFWTNSSGVTGAWTFVAQVSYYGFEINSAGAYCFSPGSNPDSASDTCLWRGAAGRMTIGGNSAGSFSGSLKLTSLITAALTYATLPASPAAGQRAYITDGNTTTYYATVSSGGGSSNISVLYNGTNWVVD
jgi:hypothetical protein